MFLIAVTSHPLGKNLEVAACGLEELQLGTLRITVATDGLLCNCAIDQAGFALVESVPGSDCIGTKLIASSATFDRAKRALSVSQATHSTRSLYYHMSAEGEFYCSTHVSMLKMAGVPIKQNTDVLPEYLLYRGVEPPETLYRDIHRVTFGGTLNIDLTASGCVLRSEDTYSPFLAGQSRTPSPQNLRRASAETIHRNLSRSIEALVPHAGRLAIVQSGGLDSSILFTLCRELLSADESYSASFPRKDPTQDTERTYAISAAVALGSNHHWYRPTSEEFLYGFLESVAVAEEPVNHLQSVMIHLLLSQAVPETGDVVLGAWGADVIFGLTRYMDIQRWNNSSAYRMLSREPVYSLLRSASIITGRGRRTLGGLRELADDIGCELRDPRHLAHFGDMRLTEKWVCDYFGVDLQDAMASRCEAIESLEPASIYDAISASKLSDVYVTSSLLSKFAEHSGKLMYFPFLEKQLMNEGFAIPWEVKLRKPKGVLRDLARNLRIPEFIITRPKSGFGWPTRAWASPGAALEPLVPLASKVFDRGELMKMQCAETESAMLFWAMLNYALWKRLCVDGEPLDTLREELAASIADCAGSRLELEVDERRGLVRSEHQNP